MHPILGSVMRYGNVSVINFHDISEVLRTLYFVHVHNLYHK